MILNLESFARVAFVTVFISSFYSATRNSATNFSSQNFFHCCYRSCVMCSLRSLLASQSFDLIVSFSLFTRQFLRNFIFFLYKERKPVPSILLPLSKTLRRNSKVQTPKLITIFTNLAQVSSYKLLGVHLSPNFRGLFTATIL